ncbi:cobalt-precorrin-6A reductase [Thioclava sp. SK-1]|uniref:cobalt-precorrin-6A reductase n=1 Tax=Thioclava sp. SK-1 TaxID=1889770 RepID=UPI000826EE20|nr:cobalt-precorrin-6A reductase [Thioclava sp. SK-1]OCX65990.1 cobalt-precorrin-6A reductase [Thioclava sp. SK-1]
MQRILLLGGTTEASQLARLLADARIRTVFSYAGRTAAPVAQPLPMRIGGFGGVDGLVTYLRKTGVTHVIDATHPFAAQMSLNAAAACADLRLPLLSLERPAWCAVPGDIWAHVPDITQAVTALPDRPGRVFLAIGKQHIAAFAAQPQHHYLLRLVDRPQQPIALPDHHVIVDRGPFDAAADTALLRDHRITHIIAKNSGGTGAQAKLTAARALGLSVIMIDRPTPPVRDTVTSPQAAMNWLIDHRHGAAAKRGV